MCRGRQHHGAKSIVILTRTRGDQASVKHWKGNTMLGHMIAFRAALADNRKGHVNATSATTTAPRSDIHVSAGR